MSAYLRQPDIDPVLLKLWGPLQIRWYSLLYVGGFLVGRWLLRRMAREERFHFTEEDVEQLILWLLVGTVIGARVVYCVFYDPQSLIANPLYLFQIYKGGLSFHGGVIGVSVAAIIFSRKKDIPFWNLADALSLATPLGLAMGRMGNFINGELWGRVTDVPWAMIFKNDLTQQPRHPSQLYESFLEGILLFIVLWWSKRFLKRDGQISFVFLGGYASARFFVEFFRAPDAHIGYLWLNLTMGQWLCVGMVLGSVIAFIRLKRREG